MSYKTMQETYDTVVEHLLKQGGPSMLKGSNVTCAYRGDNGRKCAAGILIPDDRYHPNMENKSVKAWDVRDVIEELGYVNGDLLQRLQEAHDSSAEDWNAKIVFRLREVARIYGLDTSVFDRVEFVPEVKADGR